jgi:two-component system sensor histidine kinase/response regulator
VIKMRRKNGSQFFRFTRKYTEAFHLPCMFKLCLNAICCLLISLSTLLSGQTTNQDSLLKVINILPDDTSKVNTLQNIATNYLKISRDYPKMNAFAWKALGLSQKLKYEKGMANAYVSIGIDYVYKGNNELALYYYTKALRLMQKLNNKKAQGNIYNNIARLMHINGNYVEALNNNLKSLKIKEALHDEEGMALSYLNIGNVYAVQNKLEEALGYYIKSMQLSEGSPNTNLVNACNNIGNIFGEKKNYQDALTYHLKALKICERLTDKVGMVSTCNNIGGDYFNLKQFKTALPYHAKALKLAVETGNKSGQAYACGGIGNVNQGKKKYSEASTYYAKMLKLGTELNNKKIMQQAYANFVSLNKENGNFQQALIYTDLINNMQDSLLGLESQKHLTELNTKYETEKRSKEILLLTRERELNQQQLKQQRIVRWGLVIGLLLLLSTVIGIYRRYLFKQKINQELIKTQGALYKVIEQKEKLTSILAHDLRTPLRFMTTISGYLNKSIHELNLKDLEELSDELNTSSKNTYAFADELLTWLSVQEENTSVMYSEVDLNALMNGLMDFFKDIARIQHTVLKIDIPAFLSVKSDPRLLKIILRNILDNAIKNTNSGEVLIYVSKQSEATLEIHIRDTGRGMSREQVEQLNVSNAYESQFEIKSKLGFQIIKDLSALLNIRLAVDSEIGAGTTVTLHIPVEKKEKG